MDLKKAIRRVLLAVTLVLGAGSAYAQQPQTTVAPIYPVNAKYANGVSPGYWSTPGAGLVLNISAGTAYCANTVFTFGGGTLTLTGSTTNYVYLDTASSCVPAFNTSGFTAATIPVAIVTTTTVITSIADVRTFFKANSNNTTGITSTGSPVSGNLSKWSSPSSITNGDLSGDCTTSGTLAATCTKTGGVSFAPSATTDTTNATNVGSGTLPCGRMPALTGDVTSSAGSCADAIAANAVTSAKMAIVNTRRTCVMVLGADNASAALVNADLSPQTNQCKVPMAATIVEVTLDVNNASSTTTIQIAKRHCSTFTTGKCTAFTVTNLLSGTLAASSTAFSDSCAMSSTSATCIDGTTSDASVTVSTTAVAAGDWLETSGGVADGSTKRATVTVTYTVS